MVFSHQTRDPEYFADSSGIPWNPPTIHCPDLIATAPQVSLLSLFTLLFPQSHLFLICVALTCNDSRIIPPYWTMILATCVVVDVSKYMDILTLEFSVTSEHHPFLSWV